MRSLLFTPDLTKNSAATIPINLTLSQTPASHQDTKYDSASHGVLVYFPSFCQNLLNNLRLPMEGGMLRPN